MINKSELKRGEPKSLGLNAARQIRNDQIRSRLIVHEEIKGDPVHTSRRSSNAYLFSTS